MQSPLSPRVTFRLTGTRRLCSVPSADPTSKFPCTHSHIPPAPPPSQHPPTWMWRHTSKQVPAPDKAARLPPAAAAEFRSAVHCPPIQPTVLHPKFPPNFSRGVDRARRLQCNVMRVGSPLWTGLHPRCVRAARRCALAALDVCAPPQPGRVVRRARARRIMSSPCFTPWRFQIARLAREPPRPLQRPFVPVTERELFARLNSKY